MPAAILDRIRRAENLPSLPAVAMQVLSLTRDEDSTLQQIADCIQHDPALSAKILKMVNSAYFGLTQKVASIQRAVALLGLRTVKVISLSFSVVEVMRGGEDTGFDYGGYWRRSLTCAVAARLFAMTAAPALKEEAFAGGLLCDLGMMAAHRCDSTVYAPVFQEWKSRGRRDLDVETSRLGFSHATLSRELLAGWSLPPNLCAAVGAHHGEGMDQIDEPTRKLAGILRAASELMGIFCQDVPSSELARVKKDCQGWTGLPVECVETVFETVQSGVEEMAGLLSLAIGQTLSYQQLQNEAAMQIARITMDTERQIHEAQQSAAVAGERQRKLLPSTAPKVPGCEFALSYNPAERVSGDFFDFVTFPNGNVGVLIGEVSGRGIEAGVLMGVAAKTLSLRLGEKPDPILALGLTNRDLHKELDSGVFVSAFVGVYDRAEKVFLFGRAGHQPPILYNPNRRPADLVPLASAGMVLGKDQGARFEQSIVRGRVRAQPGDLVLFYTNGVLRTRNPAGEEFGVERLNQAIRTHYASTAEELLAHVCRQLEEFRGDKPQMDDVSMLAMKIA